MPSSVYYYRDREKYKEQSKVYHKTHNEERSLAGKDYYQSNKDSIRRASKVYYYKNKFSVLCKHAERNYKIKIEVLTYYGLGKCSCVLCGENDVDVLCIDHINDDGKENRKNSFYKWLITNKFPSGFQTLCMNCNFKKEIKRKRERRGTCLS